MSVNFEPDWVVSPGETLRDWMQEHDLGVRATATTCGLAPRDIQGILSGRLRVTSALAERLEKGTRVSRKLWVNLERSYREGLANGKVDVSGG